MELFQELNQKFQTLDRFRDIPNTSSMVSIFRIHDSPRQAGPQLRPALPLALQDTRRTTTKASAHRNINKPEDELGKGDQGTS